MVRTALLYLHVKTTEKNMEYYENIEHDVSQTSQDEEKHVFSFLGTMWNLIVYNFLKNLNLESEQHRF